MSKSAAPYCLGMKHVIAILCLCCATVHAADVVFPDAEWQTATPESQGLNKQHVEAAMQYIGAVTGKQGNSQALLIRNGYIVWQGEDVENVHHVWSCSKTVMSVCFGLTCDDALLKPDDYAKDYAPELAKEYPDVQLKHLGAMTAGLGWKDKQIFVLDVPKHAPGTHYHYNSAQPNMLSYICTKVQKKGMKELFTERIAQPIGMEADAWTWGSQQHPDGTDVNGGSGKPGVGVGMNAITMARFGWLLANKGKWNGKQLISEQYIDWMSQQHWELPGVKVYDEKGWYRGIQGAYGFLCWTNGVGPDGHRYWRHLPASTFAVQGNRNNICIVIPEWNMILVRLGTDRNINCRLYDAALMTIASGMK